MANEFRKTLRKDILFALALLLFCGVALYMVPTTEEEIYGSQAAQYATGSTSSPTTTTSFNTTSTAQSTSQPIVARGLNTIWHATIGHWSTPNASNYSTGSMDYRSQSDHVLNSYGGGSTVSGTYASGSQSSQPTTYSGSTSLAVVSPRWRKTTSTMATTLSEQEQTQDPMGGPMRVGRGDNIGDPGAENPTPVGDVPMAVVLLIVGYVIWRKKSRIKE